MATVWNNSVVLATTLLAIEAIRRIVRSVTTPILKTKFRGKVVWITGASSGIGEALAYEFAKTGAKLILSARSEDKLQNVASKCRALQPESSTTPSTNNVQVLLADLSAPNDKLKEYAEKALKSFQGKIDVLVNCAGISMREAALDTTIETDSRIMHINFMAPVTLTKTILPTISNNMDGADIVIVNSVQGKFGLPYRSTYSASKHALVGYFDSIRAELTKKKVRVLNVYPGYVKTALSLNAMRGDGRLHGEMDDSTAKGSAPETLAVKIVTALARGEKELVVAGVTAHLACWLRFLLPDLFFWVMARRAVKSAP